MRGLFFLAALLLSFNLLAQKHYERFNSIDVQHYQFSLELSEVNDRIKGSASITVLFKKAVGSFTLDLVKAGEETGMSVLSVMEENKNMAFQHEQAQLKISVEAKAGETRTFQVEYEGVPQTGLIISTNKYGERTFFGDNWPDRGKHWLPIVDHPSDKATVEWIVTAPSVYKVIGSGLLQGEAVTANGFTITHWKNEIPIPTKVMVIGASRFATEVSGTVEGKEISSWVYPQDEKKGFYDYALATPITQWFVDRVGSYPFSKLANVQSKTQFGGMENAGNIFYSERSVTGTRQAEGLIAHEIAHQWFGNSASEANWHHIWLSEGFATYFTVLYMEDTYGKELAAEQLSTQRKQIVRYNQLNSVPVVNPAIEDYMELLNANSYQKGGFVLHMLRQKVGNEVFWQAIRSYYDRYKLSNALTEDLKKVFEETSGQELDPFFNQWIFQAGHPQLDVKADGKIAKLQLTQTQPGQFNFPLEVRFNYTDGSSETKRFEITEREQTLTGDTSKKLLNFQLDPDTKLLFEAKVAGN